MFSVPLTGMVNILIQLALQQTRKGVGMGGQPPKEPASISHSWVSSQFWAKASASAISAALKAAAISSRFSRASSLLSRAARVNYI